MVATRYNHAYSSAPWSQRATTTQLKQFRAKLVAAWKPKLLALVAVARKLTQFLTPIRCFQPCQAQAAETDRIHQPRRHDLRQGVRHPAIRDGDDQCSGPGGVVVASCSTAIVIRRQVSAPS
jgi:hypothetical protein